MNKVGNKTETGEGNKVETRISHHDMSPSEKIFGIDVNILRDYWCSLSEYLIAFPQNICLRQIERNIKNGKLPPFVEKVRKVILKGSVDSYIVKINPINAIHAFKTLQGGDKSHVIRIRIPIVMRKIAKLVLDVNTEASVKFNQYVRDHDTISVDVSVFNDNNGFVYVTASLDEPCLDKIKKISNITGMNVSIVILMYLNAFWLSIPEETRKKHT